MQLHTLTFTALGPFRDRQHVDFAELSAGGLFLLDGPTGAGKSSIIDAVVFALYGQVAGGNSSKYRLVSDHRDPGTEPVVELVFETGRGVYRVRRTPEFQRPKKRGDGTVTQQASVKLWKGTSPAGVDGDPLSTRAGEADDEIRDAIGLSRSQFVKTVVLPQGEFARFLQSRSDERRDILQSIFGTEHYENVQDELKRRRTGARRACDDADSQLRFAVESFVDAAEPAPEPGRGARTVIRARSGKAEEEVDVEPSADDHNAAGRDAVARATELVDDVLNAVVDARDQAEAALTAWTAELVAGLEAAQEQLTELCATAEAARSEADTRLKDTEQRRQLRDRLRAATQEKGHLEAERTEHEAREQRLDAGRRAATCRTSLDALEAVHAKLERTRNQAQDLRATVELPGIDVTVADRDDVAAAHQELRDVIAGLGDVRKLEADLPDRRDELKTLERERTKLRQNLEMIDARAEALPQRITTLEARLTAAREQAAGVAGLREERRQVGDLIEVHQNLLDTRKERENADSQRRATLRLFTMASALESDLRQRYLEGMAAELSEALKRGKPCQVCGSTKHPRPAQRTLDHVDRDEVDEAEQARLKRQEELDTYGEMLNQVATRVAELEGRLDGRTEEELRSRLAAIDTATAAAEAAEQQATELAGEVTLRREELEVCREQQRQAAADIATADTRIASRTEALERDEARVADERDGFSSVAARVGDLKRRTNAAEKLVKALTELSRQAEDQASRAAEVDRVVAEAGLENADAARAALVPSPELEALHGTVTEWHQRRHAVQGRLAEPDLAGIDPDAEIDIDEARAAFHTREAELVELRRETNSGHDRLARSRRAGAKVTNAMVARRRQHDAAAATIRMAGLTNADSPDNMQRMPLATYVLQRVFDRVVDAANERLVEMSAGRYVLEAHDGKESGSRRTGLGLRVIDAHTGNARETGTLSGGETFYVSLSLALGLADVVTSQAGGLRMGTLFIDEGFGSLDPATLDHVMAVLADLRSGGRVVGVVSHVEELKTRIPERIEVRRTRVGGPSAISVVA